VHLYSFSVQPVRRGRGDREKHEKEKDKEEDGDKDASEDGGRPLKVCAEAGRKWVRNIHQYPVLSMEWIQLVDSLKQLTRLVQLEGRMPENKKVSETLGRDDSSGGTLWDQEACESVIRIIVEEGKLYATKKGIEKTIAEFKTGAYFGELALLKNQPRAASACSSTTRGGSSQGSNRQVRILDAKPSCQHAPVGPAEKDCATPILGAQPVQLAPPPIPRFQQR